MLYPFGYGLSYTSFEWTAGSPSLASGEITPEQAGEDVTIPVTVKNTGGFAGKDVVQLYLRAPYGAESPIEKSDVVYIASVKTRLLNPGEEQTVEIGFNIRDLASFDWNDINGNGFKGYELETGSYDLLLRTDSHTDKNEGFKITYTVNGGICYNSEEMDSPLNYNRGFGENAKAVFSQQDEFNSSGIGAIGVSGAHVAERDADYVSRSDWKLPSPSSAEQLNWSDEAVSILLNQTYTSSVGTNGDRESDPWYKTAEDIPGYGKKRDQLAEGDWKQASEEEAAARKNGSTDIQLRDMIGVPIEDVRWVNFMNQLTFDEMTALTQNSWYKSPGLAAIGKPQTEEKDGPGQLMASAANGTFWSCETTISATYNTELAYEMGFHMGQECLVLGISGWYGPGMNTHRFAFNGRNFEYYSSDGRQGGYTGAAVIKGVTENGIHVYAKHFVCNDMETCRNYGGGVSVFLTEQALREIYLKPFEIAAKYGNMNGIMTCHGKVGMIRVESNYNLCNYFLYDECGYDGSSVTDADAGAYTTTIGGSAQQVTGDMLERCRVVPLAWNETPASSDAALNGRKVEGRYDADENKLMVPEIIVDQTKWHFTGNHDAYEETTGYQTTVTAGDAWDRESPTQWYAVRTNAMYLLYQAANSAQMGLGNGDQVGCVVTVHYNDGITGDTEIKCGTGQLIEQPAAPAINAAKERFVGWYTDRECTRQAKFPMSVTKSVQLYPLIVPMTLCVQSYDLNYDGAPAGSNEYYETGGKVNLPPFDPVRDGYVFDGWYLEKSCVNRVDPSDSDSLVIDFDRTYYAKWTAVPKFVVSFLYNYDGAPGAGYEAVNAGEKILPPLFVPERNGYVFTGWYTDESCEYAADFTQAIEYDVRFYAGWEKTETRASGCNGVISAGTSAGTLILLAAGLVVSAKFRVYKNKKLKIKLV